MREMHIDSIRVSLMNYQRVVVLKERQAERYLPIWIGSPEADAITVRLQSIQTPRPLTHDLLGSVIATLGASVQRVVVTDLANDTLRLPQDELDDAGLLLPALGEVAGEGGGLDGVEVDGAPFRLGDNLGGDDDDVAIGEGFAASSG